MRPYPFSMTNNAEARTQLKVAWIALASVVVGAVIAGAGSFAATYVVSQIQSAAEGREQVREAYIEFFAAAESLRFLQGELRAAAERGDQVAYDAALKPTQSGNVELSTTGTQLMLITDEMPIAIEVWRLLGRTYPYTAAEFDVQGALELETKSAELLSKMIDEAESVLD